MSIPKSDCTQSLIEYIQQRERPDRQVWTREPDVRFIPSPLREYVNLHPPRPPDWLTRLELSPDRAINSEIAMRLDWGDYPYFIQDEFVDFDNMHARYPVNTCIDAIAWYLPYHSHGQSWGVYISTNGLLWFASLIAKQQPAFLKEELFEFVYGLVLRHELFHFIIETACSQFEVLTSFLEIPFYSLYAKTQYAILHEEAVANAYAYRLALRGKPRWLKKAVYNQMKSQGPGYHDFDQWLSSKKFLEACRIAAYCFRMCDKWYSGVVIYPNGIIAPHRGFQSWTDAGVDMPTENLFYNISVTGVPTYIVHDMRPLTLGIVKPLPKHGGIRMRVYTKDHPPPHVHVELYPAGKRTRVLWPTCQTFPGDPPLTSRERKRVEKYVEKFKKEINNKVNKVWPHHPIGERG